MLHESVLPRGKRPVFVMGCHRSGTNLLYDNLLSAGGFAVYRGYLPIYKMLIPRFGDLADPANRKQMVKTWLQSKGFRRAGLDPSEHAQKLLDGCRTGGDFIRLTMEDIAKKQGARRWAVYDPDNVLYVPKIKRDIPDALFVHIIRDGRDIALSLKKMGGFVPLPWDRSETRSLLATAMYWEWMVRKGREYGADIPEDYFEVRYEELVSNPTETLSSLGRFLDHDLDYDRIRGASLGRLRETNSSFSEEGRQEKLKPVNRWKERLSAENILALEATVGAYLAELGYPLTTSEQDRAQASSSRLMRSVYPTFLNTKLWLKTETPVGRMANLSALELEGASQ
jgi:sulfotransferase family protein